MKDKLIAVEVKNACPNCGEEVTIFITKKQVKAMFKAFKYSDPSLAEMNVEKSLGRDKLGNLKG